MKLIIEDERGRRTPVQLNREEVTIGRSDDNVIRLTEQNVSRHHARVTVEDGTVFIEDSSRYGSKLNGRRFTGKVSLSPGDVAKIGEYKFSLAGEKGGESKGAPGPPRLVPRAVVTFGPPRFLARSPGLEARCWFVADGMVIGSHPKSDIVIERPNIVPQHIRIQQREDGTWWLVQHENGTFFQVNGELTDEKQLERGDRLRIGDAVLKFIGEDELHVGYPARNVDAMQRRYENAMRMKNVAMLLFGLVIVAAFTVAVLSTRSG
jgi:pSer/pThr/pTyr-binding forkhead associated (FHA) protein